MKKLQFMRSYGMAVILAGFTFSSCSDSDDPIVQQEDYSSNLNNIVLNVVVSNYSILAEKAELMSTAANAITIGDNAKLLAARNAWKEMRIHWENSESTLFGPAGDEGLGVDGNIDSWPIDLQFVTNVINGTTPITVSFIANQDANAKGFHALEYLLWGIDGTKTASQLTAREIDYIKATAGYIAQQTSGLHNAWKPTGSNFAANFTNASSGIYRSQKSALLQVVDGMIEIADEVGNGKIYDPLYGNNGSYSLEDEESRFSNNSKADFADNIRGIKYTYSGDFGTNNGAGISEIVASKNAALDTEVKAKIDAAVNAIEAIPGTFTSAIQNNRAAVENAKDKVIELHTVLDSKLKPFLDAL